jgi:flagellar basal body P-ring formation protein FlgA
MHAQLFLLILALTSSSLALSDQADLVLDTAERYAHLQTQGLPGKVTIRMGKFNASRLPPCSALEAYSPPGSRMSGKTYIGVRCLGPNIWNVLVPAQIAVSGNYLITSRALPAGQALQADDLSIRNGDIFSLPTGVITEPDNAIGKILRNSLGAGQAIRSDQLLAPLVIHQGQTVRVVTGGTGFAVSGEGKAMNNAAEGQVARVRMSSGQTINGIAKADGTVEISF